MSTPPIDGLFVHITDSLEQVMCSIDRSGRIGLALLVDENKRLIATITDGDIRRGLLAGLTLEATMADLLPIKERMPNPKAVTAFFGCDSVVQRCLMQERGVRHLPLVDEQGTVVDVVTLRDLVPEPPPGMRAVIMAGGFGTRLRPLTDDLPKPMLPVGGRPVMEWIVDQMRSAGIRHINVTTHYKPEKVVEHFGDGRDFGVEIRYVSEDLPLGTGGALSLIPPDSEPLLVVNGDVLSRVDYRQMLEFHNDHGGDMTVALKRHVVDIPYGVITCEGPVVRRLEEKPCLTMHVNAGIYLLQPSVYEHVPAGESFNMTDLIQWLLDAGKSVIGFPIREYWLDIGQHADYGRAQTDCEDGRLTE
jgi:dTDP-glucose pyrophosphorylase/CBS domain-containing protein